MGKPDLDIARNTWEYDPHAVKFRSYLGWRQNNIFATCLGLTKEAAAPDHHVNCGGMWFVPPFTSFLN